MTSTSFNIDEVLRKLSVKKFTNDTITVLTFINSDAGRVNILKTMDNNQLFELCKVLVNFLVNDDENVQKNKELIDVNEKVQQALRNVLKDVKSGLNFFEIISKIERVKWLKIFQFMKTLDDDVLLKISKDQFTVKYLDNCMQTVNPDKMEWLDPSACTDNIQSLLEAEEKCAKYLEEQLVINTMSYLERLYGIIPNNSKFDIERFHLLVFEKVLILTYMGHKKQRTTGLRLIHRALRTDFVDFIRTNHEGALQLFKTNLQKHYYIRMSSLVKAKQSDWYYLWCLSLELVGTDLHRGADLINNLLAVEEKAFKSTDMTIRLQAFIAWKSLINVFARDPAQIVIPRRIKLLCTPLNANNSKTELIAVEKLKVWWHLIVKLYPYIDKLSKEVTFPFLNFCFGPLGETPLLSTKCDLASPGKRFIKARVYAVNALLQLLVADDKERRHVSLVSDQQTIPHAITFNIFRDNYKSFIHSVGEAVLIVSNLADQSDATRIKLNNILWLNLMGYVQQSSKNVKVKMCEELVAIIGEIINHLDDSSLISDVLINVIVPEFTKIIEHLDNCDPTMSDLLIKLLSPKLSIKIEKKHWSDIKRLLCHVIKPDNVNSYNPNTLSFVKSLLSEMQLMVESKVNNNLIVELWCVLTESIIKYIADNQQINEGTISACNFETIYSLLYFPLKNICWSNFEQLLKMTKVWKELYRQFNAQADLIINVKYSQILNNVSEVMEKCLLAEKKCCSFILQCLNMLMSTIHYGELLKQETLPPILILLRDVTKITLTDMANIPEMECALKAMSSLLITVYGLNLDKVLQYLDNISSVVESLLKVNATETIQKEIVNTWDTIVLILRGITKHLNYDFLLSYRESIICGLCHTNAEIASQTLSLLEIKKDLDDKCKDLMNKIEDDAKKLINTKKVTHETKSDGFSKVPKSVKLVGSFIGRQLSSPKVVLIKKEKEKKILAPPPPPPPEPDSQDYVPINNDIKVNINLLTEHQKERFKQRKDDIPAMYNELSQSGSCNTQELEQWFKDKAANANAHTKVALPSSSVDNDANRENKNDSKTDVGMNKISKLNQLSKAADQLEVGKINHESSDGKSTSSEELSPTSVDGDDDNNQVTEMVAKKLNFESLEEFPDERDNSDDSKHSMRVSVKRRGRLVNSVYSRVQRDNPEENKESQNLETSQIKRSRGRRRSSKLNDKIPMETEESGKTLKRKAAGAEPDEDLISKRRRHTVIPAQTDIKHDNQNNTVKSPNTAEGTKSVTDSNLPKRTKMEISRLKIDMVFDSKMTSKLRSKPSDDFIYDSTVKRHSADSKTTRQKAIKHDKEIGQNEASQELTKRRRRRDSKNSPEIKTDVNSAHDNENSTNIAKNIENHKDTTDSERDSDKSITEKDNINELNNDFNDSSQIINSSIVNSTCKHESSQDDEVIESSQESSIRNSLKRNDKKLIGNNDKNDLSPTASTQKDSIQVSTSSASLSVATGKSSPMKDTKIQDSQCTVILTTNPLIESKKLQLNDVKSSSNSLLHSSPKAKRMSRVNAYTLPGRAAHILDLVTKKAIKDKKFGKYSADVDEDNNEPEGKEVTSTKEIVDTSAVKKDYFGLFKESERLSSPSGHRQEKMFSNMKSSADINATSPPALFSNLKNNGEKISPKMEKAVKDMNELNDHDYTEIKDVDNSLKYDREELPMLEWSSANPPSLTASPSASILKRQRQSYVDTETETTPRRKRVSFADPPVSKQMGYEIVSNTMSPTKSKLGSSFSFPGRKGTPYRSRQSKLRIIEIPAEKQILLSNGNDSTTQNNNNNKDNENFANISVGLEDQFKDIEVSIVDPMETDYNFVENHDGHCLSSSLSKDKETKIDVKSEKEMCIQESETQKDVFHEDENKVKNTLLDTPNIKDKNNMSLDISHTKDKNDSIITRIVNGSMEDDKSEVLEDTVDIQNVSNLTANSDDLFYNKPTRTNSQVAAINAFAECDTLPLTDSVFSSQSSLQTGTGMQKSLSQLLSQRDTTPIYPELLNSKEPIINIIDSLTNPPWVKNLSKYFVLRNINTVGDLARLTEQQVTQIPLNKSPKVSFVKKTLHEFLKSRNNVLIHDKYYNNKKIRNQQLEIVNETQESVTKDDSTAISPFSPSIVPSNNFDISEVLTNQMQQSHEDKVSGSYGSIILDTSISPPTKTSTVLINQIPELPPLTKVSIAISTDPSVLTNTRAVEVQTKLEELLDELDGNLLLQSAVRKISSQDILKEYKKKMADSSEEDLEKDIMNIFGITSAETGLKNACRDYGLENVLSRLSTIFKDDEHFYTKVLHTYRAKITAMDTLSTVNLDEIKKEFCKICSSDEMCDMMLKVLTKEENDGINTEIKNTLNLVAMLKRMPIDVIVNNIIANDKVIPSSVVLDVALLTNSCDKIFKALEELSLDVRQQALEKYLTPNDLVSYAKNKKIPKEQLLDIYKIIGNQLTTNEVIDLNAEILKMKFQQH